LYNTYIATRSTQLKRTREQLSEEIMRLEIEAGKIVAQAGGHANDIYGSNLFPKDHPQSTEVKESTVKTLILTGSLFGVIINT
jgi:tryptophanase